MQQTILVVDDQPGFRQMIRFALQLQGLQVIEAEDGIGALEQLSRHAVDLLVTDWKMPNMDGLELARKVRATHGMETLPIILLDDDNNLPARREASAIGILAWLQKPFRINEVQTLVSSGLIGKSPNRLPAQKLEPH